MDEYLKTNNATELNNIPTPEVWTALFNNHQLNELIIRNYWAFIVPGIYSPTRNCNCLSITFDDEIARKLLFLPLETFITQSDEPQKVFESLKKTDNNPRLCGKVFKNGEPVYSCKDCGLDNTCVLCVECFKRSAHREHKYRMHMSEGAGYCDCGDPEAWMKDIFCELHIKGCNQSGGDDDPRKRLPQDLAQRAEFMIRTIVHYCYEMLEWDQFTSLPESLQVDPPPGHDPGSEDYATMLFNDESHTYEQVIQTLSRAIDCSTKEAIDFATTIDHEGRSIVKCSIFQTCSHVKQTIEKITGRQGTKPLRCHVMRTSVIAHQNFAIKLLSWLQQLLYYCEGFRRTFTSIMMEEFPPDARNPGSLLEAVMKADVRLWKTARIQWHQLFIVGLLMNAESKKAFAKTFTRIYSTLMKDYINDDHEHAVSIASLAVQIFTVPTLAHTLIAEDDAFNMLIKTFLAECRKHRNHTGKLAFERNIVTLNQFKRVQYILNDMRYLLSQKPRTWTDELRSSFYRGFVRLVELTSLMQGMDSVTRQIGAHVEFEAEWETGINLQLKVAMDLTLVIEWCGSDLEILKKCLRHSLSMLRGEPQMNLKYENLTIGYKTARCIQYDVACSSVTVHLPLSRLNAGLLLHLTMKDPSYIEELTLHVPPQQLMELPLRTLVLVAQFRAGMWRRNGYSLVNQIYFYHNVRLRDEMYDRDIMMLQIAAASIDPDSFLIQIMNKFNLMIWAQEDYDSRSRKPEEDHVRQTVALAEEFLNLLLIIVSERFTPGIGNVTFEDRMKREIIHWLCTNSMTHSDLLKCLPRDTSDEVAVATLILEVADFKRPASNQPGGKYKVKSEFYSQFNPFFYHYTRQDQSTAEEVQMRRKRNNGEKLICCPPPVPPDFTPYFLPILKIFKSDTFLHIINSVLKRACNYNSLSFSETQFEKILHLIGVALHEEVKHLLNPATNADVSYDFYDRAVKSGLLCNLEACLDHARIGTYRDLLAWTLKKFNEVAKLRGEGQPSTSSLSTVAEQIDDDKSSEGVKNVRAKLVADRKARIMAQMKDMQKNFIKDNADYFEKTELGSFGTGSMMDLSTDEYNKESLQPCAIGKNQRGKEIFNESHICILCREEQTTDVTSRCMVLAAYVQGSTVLSKNRSRHPKQHGICKETPLMQSDLSFGCHLSTCGHVMHSECWKKFFEAVLSKERRRPLRFGRHISFDIDKNEFLCPLCECLSNAVIPLIPPSFYRDLDPKLYTRDIQFSDWINILSSAAHHPPKDSQSIADGSSIIFPEATTVQVICAQVPGLSSILESDSDEKSQLGVEYFKKLSSGVKEMMKQLTKSIKDVYSNARREEYDYDFTLADYWSAAFTIHSIERVLRDDRKSVFGDLSSRRYNCLRALVRYVGVIAIGELSLFARTYCMRLIRYLFNYDSHIANQSCLDVDAFGLLLTLVLSSPTIVHDIESDTIPLPAVPNGSISDQYFVNLIVVFHCIQIILANDDLATCETDSMEVDMPSEGEDESELRFVNQFYRNILLESLDLKQNTCEEQSRDDDMHFDKLRAVHILKSLKVKLIPFLRCTALFFHFLTGVVPPERLKEGISQSTPSPDFEYNLLCEYLGLPSKLSSLINEKILKNVINIWCHHPHIKPRLYSYSNVPSLFSPQSIESSKLSPSSPLEHKHTKELPLIAQPHTVNQLINLPKDYSELINKVCDFTCPKSEGDDARTPTICLVCGTILCSQSYCCQIEIDQGMVGAATYHAHTCGAGVGIFLRIRDCKILLLAGRSKGCYMPAPYIDEYGETDQGLHRGYPLTLCTRSYKKLHRLWLRHGIPEQVAHALELHSNMATINWALI